MKYKMMVQKKSMLASSFIKMAATKIKAKKESSK